MFPSNRFSTTESLAICLLILLATCPRGQECYKSARTRGRSLPPSNIPLKYNDGDGKLSSFSIYPSDDDGYDQDDQLESGRGELHQIEQHLNRIREFIEITNRAIVAKVDLQEIKFREMSRSIETLSSNINK